jgi:hypothetical protein
MKILISSYIVTFLLLILIPEPHVRHAFFVIAMAHFVLTYLHYYRIGKYSKSTAIYPIIFAFLYFIFSADPKLFIAFVAALFLFHNFYDEMHISNVENNGFRLLSFLPIFINMMAYEYFLPHFNNLNAANALFSISFLPLVLALVRRDFSGYTIYNSISSIFVSLILFFHLVPVKYLWSGFIIFHCVMWYIKVGQKLRLENKIFYQNFVRESLLVNALVILLWFGAYKHFLPSQVYDYFFSPVAFFSWTLLHLMLVTRASDLRMLLPAIMRR